MGNRGHVGIKKEITWGTEENGANDFHLPFLSESLTENIEEVLSAIQRGILDEPKSYQGEKSFGGDVVVEVHPASFGHILRSALGVPSGPDKAGATILTLEDCEDAWDETEGKNDGVISGVDPIDKKKGSNAVKLIVTVGVAGGEILATEKIDSTDMKADTALKVWVKCNKACDAGHLQLVLDETAGCKGATHKLANIPALEIGVWKECTIPLGYMSRSDIEFHDGAEGVDTITTVDGNFESAGFVAGDKVKITGTDSDNDDVTVTLTVVAEKTLTMATGSGIVDDAVGDAILNAMADYDAVVSVGIKMVEDKAECTIHLDDLRRVGAYTADAAWKWEFKPRQDTDFNVDCPINPYTLEVYRDQGDAFQFLGAIVNTLALSFSTTDKILKATCGIIAKDVGDVGKSTLALETTDPFVWSNAVISIGNSPAVNKDIDSFSLTFDNKCVAKYALDNTAKPRKIIRSGYREIPISFSIEFLNRTEYTIFKAGDEQAFQIKFEGAEIETGFKYTLQIDIPKFRYLTYPINIGGPGPIVCGVTGKAKYDATAGVLYPIKFTLINKEVVGEY